MKKDVVKLIALAALAAALSAAAGAFESWVEQVQTKPDLYDVARQR